MVQGARRQCIPGSQNKSSPRNALNPPKRKADGDSKHEAEQPALVSPSNNGAAITTRSKKKKQDSNGETKREDE